MQTSFAFAFPTLSLFLYEHTILNLESNHFTNLSHIHKRIYTFIYMYNVTDKEAIGLLRTLLTACPFCCSGSLSTFFFLGRLVQGLASLSSYSFALCACRRSPLLFVVAARLVIELIVLTHICFSFSLRPTPERPSSRKEA